MGFNLPRPPDHLVFPSTPQTVAEIVIGAVAVLFVIYALAEWRRVRAPLALILLVGGAVAFLNEPIDDVLGLVWHPRPNQHVALETFGPVPLWGLPTYIIFFGGMPYLLLQAIQSGAVTLKRFWIGATIFGIVDLAIELPLLHFGLYSYYGHGTPPMEVGGLPLYWLLINVGGPVLTAAILSAAPRYFEGWRALALVLLPMTTDAACSVAVGWPVYSAINAPHVAQIFQWGAAVLSIIIGLLVLQGLGRFITARTPTAVAPIRGHTALIDGTPKQNLLVSSPARPQ